MSSNQFTSIPPEIQYLDQLEELALQYNSLTGGIVEELGSLASLKRLGLTANQLTGNIPAAIGGLEHLEVLSLNNNNLTGSLPSAIGNLHSLVLLDLRQNSLAGPIPASIGGLTNLVYMHCAGNQFTSIPPEIGLLSSLEDLSLPVNAIAGNIPTEIGNLTSLKQLNLSSNQLSGNVPVSVGSITNLEVLTLTNNALTGALPSSLGNLKKLTILDLSQNNISGTIPPELGEMTALQTITLANNQLTGSIPSTIGNLVNLRMLELQNNQLTGSIPGEIREMVNLEYVTLANNPLSGSLPALETLTKLIQLNIYSNNLSGQLIVNSPVLNAFRLSFNKLTFSGFLPVMLAHPQVNFEYTPQDSVDVVKTVSGAVGQSINLTTSIDRNTNPASIYQWFKVVNSITTPPDFASTGGHTLTIPSVSEADTGTKYYYTITNPAASGLTLTSRIQKLQLVTCSTPTLNFVTEELNGTHTFNPTFTGEGCTPTYIWDFGDGTTSTEQAATHAYTETGTFTVTLTVSYTCGPCPSGQLTTSHEVTIENGFCGSIYCDGAGGVGIGTQVTEGFRLSVNGKIRASDIIKVYPQGQWSDFVFEKDYKLRPLSEVETFIRANGHLPEIPWTLNPGSISRLVNGYPDDHNNVTNVDRSFWEGETETYTVGVSVGMANVANVSAGMSFAQDTYKGFGIGQYMGFGVGYKINDNVGIGANFTTGTTPFGDSYTSAGLSLGINSGSQQAFTLSSNVGLNVNSRTGLNAGAGAGVGVGFHSLMDASISSSGGNKASLAVGGGAAGVYNSRANNVSINSESFQADIPVWYGVSVRLGRDYQRYWIDEKESVSTFGSLYLNSIQPDFLTAFDTYDLLDTEIDIALHNNPEKVLGGSFPDYDLYTVTAQGLSGNIRPYHFQQHLYRQDKRDAADNQKNMRIPGI